MDQVNNTGYDEISLRELIGALLDGWKIITIITIISLLASGIFSFIITDPTYEAETTLMASLATDRLTNMNIESEDIEGILNSISAYPTMTLQTYKQQIKNPQILIETIEELELSKEDITIDSLTNMISLETMKDTNLIVVKVSNSDKELATKIANTIAQKFTSFITDMAREHASKTSGFINSQLEVEKEKVDQALLDLKVFLAQPRGVEELNKEIQSKQQELNDYKDRLSREEVNYKDALLQKEMEEKLISAQLKSAKEQLNNTSKKLVTKKSILEDSLLSDMIKESSNSTTKDIADIEMENEEINPAYITLIESINEYEIDLNKVKQEKENITYSYKKIKEILSDKIDIVKQDVESLQVELAEKEHQEKLILRNVNLAQSIYDSFLEKYEATRVAESTEIGESSINIVSKAITPEKPVAPNKKLNLAIAGVLGVMIGVFVVFFRQYWIGSKEKPAIN